MKTTKNILSIAFALVMLFSLTDCTGQKSDTATAKPVTKPEIKANQKTGKEDLSTAKYKVTFIELGSVRCIPCQQMQPVMKSIEEKFGKDVKVVFHDVWTDAGAPYAQKYGIEAIPTQVFLDKDGKEFFRHVGFFPEEELIKVLQQKGVK